MQVTKPDKNRQFKTLQNYAKLCKNRQITEIDIDIELLKKQ